MSRNLYERLRSGHLPMTAEADDGAPGGTTDEGRRTKDEGPPATDDSSQAHRLTDDHRSNPQSAIRNPQSDGAPIAPIGGEVTPPAAPAPAQSPVAPVASEPSTSHVFTEAEVNNRLAQQRAQFDRQIQNLKLQNAAIATGVQGADVLLERIDRKAITYDEAGKPTNLADLLNAQRDAMAQALGLAPPSPAEAQAPAPAAPAIPQIAPTNGSGAPGGPALEEANLFAEGLFRK